MVESISRILVINPGSTSTKVAVFEDTACLAQSIINHAPEDFRDCPDIPAQRDLRSRCLMEFLQEQDIPCETLRAVVGRGGILKPLASGTYAVNDRMLTDLHTEKAGTHASCLGGIMAADIGQRFHIPAYIVDPVCVDELEPEARLSGLPDIPRRSTFHALNAKAVARICAQEMNLRYADGRFVVVHMGGGVSVSAHRCGRVIDVNDALNGEGPFSPERSGGVPLSQLIECCFEGGLSMQEALAMVRRRGGMLAYLGTNDLREAHRRMDAGDSDAALVVNAMAYQIAKEIGAMAAALEGDVDAIALTGGMARSARFVALIERRVRRLAPVRVYPGEMEMEALAMGALRVLRGDEPAKTYT